MFLGRKRKVKTLSQKYTMNDWVMNDCLLEILGEIILTFYARMEQMMTETWGVGVLGWVGEKGGLTMHVFDWRKNNELLIYTRDY